MLYTLQSLIQPCWLQRSLNTSLDALSYTSNVLLAMAALGVLGGLFLIAFSGEVASMSHGIASINEMEKKYLNEKVDVLSVDIVSSTVPSKVVITLVNYGKYDSQILAILTDVGKDLTCTANGSDLESLVIEPENKVEITCDITVNPESFIDSNDPKFYVLTDTRQILTAKP